jgi:hypothetical protein
MGWRVEFSRKEGLWYFVSRMVYRRAEKGKDSAFGIG